MKWVVISFNRILKVSKGLSLNAVCCLTECVLSCLHNIETEKKQGSCLIIISAAYVILKIKYNTNLVSASMALITVDYNLTTTKSSHI